MNGRTDIRTNSGRGFVMLGHYPELLAWGWRVKFFTTKQLQRRFGLRSLRTANDQARQLVRQRLLAPVPIRAVLPNHEYVYVTLGRGLRAALGERGRDFVWHSQDRRARRGYGLAFIAHELGITDMDIAQRETVQQRSDLALVDSQRRFRARPLTYFRDEQQHRLEPDARYDVMHILPDRQWRDVMFYEDDRGTMDQRALVEKLQRYDHWLIDNKDQLSPPAQSADIRLLIKTQARLGDGNDDQRIIKLLIATFSVSPWLQRRIWVTSNGDFQRHIDDQAPLAARIWVRARDIKHLREQIEHTNNPAQQRTLIRDNFQHLRRYTLFPPQ